MSKVIYEKGFKTAEITKLPKGIDILANCPDGSYIALKEFRPRNTYGERMHISHTVAAGALIISTEGGHLYVVNPKGALKGMGKNASRSHMSVLVQRVNVDFIISDFIAPKVKKKVVKKKKKVVKKAKK